MHFYFHHYSSIYFEKQITADCQLIKFNELKLGIIFWGEIYNFIVQKKTAKATKNKIPFNTSLPIAKGFKEDGIEFIKKLNGHFALIIYDYQKKILWCFNDRYNSIPIYFVFSKAKKSILFSTDLKYFREKGQYSFDLNWNHIFGLPTPSITKFVASTFLENVWRLDGGTCLKIGIDQFQINTEKYWSLSETYFEGIEKKIYINCDIPDLIKEYRRLIKSSVNKRSQDSEGIASLLSGGLDSSILSLIAGKINQLPLFSICTPNSWNNKEMNRAHALSKFLGCNHYILPIALTKPIDPFDWWETVLQIQSISCDIDAYAKNKIALAVSSHKPKITHVLNGYGSDQLNGGTTAFDYSKGNSHQNWEEIYSALKISKTGKRNNFGTNNFHKFSNYFIKDSEYKKERKCNEKDFWLTYLIANRRHQLHNRALVESHSGLNNQIYYRYPFWDNELIDFTLQIPKRFRAQLLFNKNIAREAFKDELPKEYRNFPKFKSVDGLHILVYNFLKPIIYENNYYLLRLIFSESEEINRVFSFNKILQFVKHFEKNEYYPAYEHILQIINIGLLDVFYTKQIAPTKKTLNPEILKIKDWPTFKMSL